MFAELLDAKDSPWADATLRGSSHKMALQGAWGGGLGRCVEFHLCTTAQELHLEVQAPSEPTTADVFTRDIAPSWNICNLSNTFPHL